MKKKLGLLGATLLLDENAADDLRQADPELRGELAGDYLKYDLMVAHLLDRRRADVGELLKHPPEAGEVERAARQ